MQVPGGLIELGRYPAQLVVIGRVRGNEFPAIAPRAVDVDERLDVCDKSRANLKAHPLDSRILGAPGQDEGSGQRGS